MPGANYVEITEVCSQQSAVCCQCLGGLSCIKGGMYGNIYERPIWKQSIGHYNSYYGNSANNRWQWNMLCHANRIQRDPAFWVFSLRNTSPHENYKKLPQNWRYKNKFPFRIILDKYYNILKKECQWNIFYLLPIDWRMRQWCKWIGDGAFAIPMYFKLCSVLLLFSWKNILH